MSAPLSWTRGRLTTFGAQNGPDRARVPAAALRRWHAFGRQDAGDLGKRLARTLHPVDPIPNPGGQRPRPAELHTLSLLDRQRLSCSLRDQPPLEPLALGP